jgi:hypothetical protein
MALSKLTVRRLTKLIEFMEKLPKSASKHFEMAVFLSHEYNDHHHGVPKSQRDLHTCGTTACALGWAATMPYFRRLGLRFNDNLTVDGDEEIFPVGSQKWDKLFGGSNKDKTPKEWAKRARGLLKEWSAQS